MGEFSLDSDCTKKSPDQSELKAYGKDLSEPLGRLGEKTDDAKECYKNQSLYQRKTSRKRCRKDAHNDSNQKQLCELVFICILFLRKIWVWHLKEPWIERLSPQTSSPSLSC